MQERSAVFFGTSDPGEPRNAQMLRMLAASGVRVERCVTPLLPGIAKDAASEARFTAVLLALSLPFVYASLLVRFLWKHRRTEEIRIGVMGQVDILAVKPFAKVLKIPVIFDPLIYLHDTIVNDRKMLHEHSLGAKFLKFLDTRAFRAADRIVVDTSANAAFLEREFGVPKEKIDILLIEPDPQFVPMPLERKEPDAFRVLLYGKFIPLHGVDVILNAWKIVEQASRQRSLNETGAAHGISLTLVGRGQTYGDARSLAQSLGLQHIEWIDWIPYEHLPAFISGFDLCLGVFGNSDKARRVIPNKVWQALACGKPVISRKRMLPDDHPLLEKLIEVEPNPETLAEGILREALKT